MRLAAREASRSSRNGQRESAEEQREGSVQLSNCPAQAKGELERPSVRDRIGSFQNHVGKGTSLLVP
jgi:hypothetical protein